ncbi:MAG: Ig-like domain-containing protein, partial [Verrucomicrobiales bacterium]|nr:Ig-like domain-containing protein [Verrucomicrobiales bacterium]
MNYFLLITDANGESRIVPVNDVESIPVNPGDDIVVMDEQGNPVDVSLRPDEESLIVDFGEGKKAVLEDFYQTEEGQMPVTISLNPVEPVADEYEFNSQTGNLPNSKGFTLMRYSNTEYVQFVEQLDDLNVGHLLNGIGEPGRGGFGGGGSGGSTPAAGDSECCDDKQDKILDPVPAAAPDSGSGIAGGPPINIDLLANDTDNRGGGLKIHSIGGIGVSVGVTIELASGSTVQVNADGTVDFQPGENFDALTDGETGTETFIYSIRDKGGNIATSQVTVTVTGVNDPPEALPDEFELTEDAPITVNVLNNDSDPDTGDTLTVTGVSAPPSGQVVTNGDNTLTFDPDGDFESLAEGESATVTVTYTISDDSGLTATSTATFVIHGENDPPDAVDDDRTTDQNTPLMIDAVANDTDPDASDSLIIIGVDQPEKGFVSIDSNNQLAFDPEDEFASLGVGQSEEVTFDYTVSDGNGGTATATVTVTVTGVNDPTETNPDFDVTDEETAVTVDVLANDTDPDANDSLTIAATTQPSKGSVSIAPDNLTVDFDPDGDFDSLAVGESEVVTFTYTAVAAGSGESTTETVTVTVTGTNDGPVAVDDNGSVDEDATLAVPVLTGTLSNDTDADTSDVLTVSDIRTGAEGGSGTSGLVGAPLTGTYGTLTLQSDGSYSYAADQAVTDSLDDGDVVTDVFTYTIDDGNGGTDTAQLTITVTGTNDATVTNPDEDTTDQDSVIAIDVLANDSDADADDTLTIGAITQPGKGTVVNNGTDVSFDPDGDFD